MGVSSQEIKEELGIPTTRQGRLSGILETIKANPGTPVRTLIDTFHFGLKRVTVAEMFRDLERAKKIRLDRMGRVFIRE